jgi:hypothetical protein
MPVAIPAKKEEARFCTTKDNETADKTSSPNRESQMLSTSILRPGFGQYLK